MSSSRYPPIYSMYTQPFERGRSIHCIVLIWTGKKHPLLSLHFRVERFLHTASDNQEELFKNLKILHFYFYTSNGSFICIERHWTMKKNFKNFIIQFKRFFRTYTQNNRIMKKNFKNLKILHFNSNDSFVRIHRTVG